MASLNKVMLIGYVGRDPEVRYSPSGVSVANFSVATSEVSKDKSGEKKEITEWHNIVAFGKTADICGQYAKKGKLVYVEGRIKTEKYTGKDGLERSATKIIADAVRLLGSRSDGELTAPESQVSLNPIEAPAVAKSINFDDIADDIPF